MKTLLSVSFFYEEEKSEQDIAREREEQMEQRRVQRASNRSKLCETHVPGKAKSKEDAKIVSETVSGSMSREELLDLRSKKKGDRWC